MKVFVLTRLAKIKEIENNLNQITRTVENQGHEIVNDIFSAKNIPIHKGGKGVREAYSKIFKRMKSADAIIAEITYPSSGVGFLINTALTERKHILALIDENITHTAMPIQATKSQYLTFVTYNTNNLESIIKSYCKNVKNKLDSKFILTLNPETNKFLTWLATDKGVSKAQIIREALETKRSQDRRYRKHLEKMEDQ